ncbi:hypothetical protein BW727_200011 (plasmid) [Jeotgalibaca dankookensis]|uniref:Uncharacterized protein n=1 Tax=Jeotgalibaca dankookensis TaxID=708126 RepID=A0A1S6ISA6_9LACT|nr:hypothetical protein [Jeotgalibaca dankookensis]AQS54414.1 hypothetical protein BW727_200011 [Jeotgalibaca dankookensis]
MITIIRQTEIGGNALAIKLNKKKVATIYPGQQIQVELPKESAMLQVSEWGFKSKPLEVKDGETIDITNWEKTNKINFLSIPLHFIGFTLISFYVPTFRLRMIASMIYLAVYLLVMLQLNWYQLKKRDLSTG